jgi:hypothetical protein
MLNAEANERERRAILVGEDPYAVIMPDSIHPFRQMPLPPLLPAMPWRLRSWRTMRWSWASRTS